MTFKKILSAFLIGAFMFGVPAANFDMPLTKTVSAGYALSAQRKAELEAELNRARLDCEQARADYEKARQNYENAVKSQKYSDSEIKNRKDKYLKAKQNYENKKEILDKKEKEKEKEILDKKEREIQKDLERLDEATKNKNAKPKFDGIG